LDDGLIADWEWLSSKDGFLHGESGIFSTSTLSIGTHIIQFRVKDDEGQWSDYDERTLTIDAEETPGNQRPSAQITSITPSQIFVGESVSFSGQGTDSDGYVVGYSWQSSIDGTLNSKSSFSTDQLSVGTHSISFKVKDNDGEWSTPVTSSVKVLQADDDNGTGPVADCGGGYSGMINIPVVFDASGSYGPDEGSIESYEWEFGDGTTGAGVIITHSYNNTGNYTVHVTVTDAHDDTDTCTTYAHILDDDNGSGDDPGSSESSSDSTPGFLVYIFLISLFLILCINRKQG
jgi:chitodextrinase